MGRSKREKGISEVGRLLERELGLVQSSDTLARWMAYRLAELRQIAEISSDLGERERVNAEADALIIALWEKKASLPGNLDPNRRFETGLAVLQKLTKEQSFWDPSPENPGSPDALLEKLKSAARDLTLHLGLLQIESATAHEGLNEQNLPLNRQELLLRKRYGDLRDLVFRGLQVRRLSEETKKPSAEETQALLRSAALAELAQISSTVSALRKFLEPRRARVPKSSQRNETHQTPIPPHPDSEP